MNHLHQILLQPTDVLFFRDGRPMGGSFAGHTAAWPLPDVTNHALHAALHRAEFPDVHGHDHKTANGSVQKNGKDVRKFGSLVTAGPFPVRDGHWYFPKPADAEGANSVAVTLRPISGEWSRNGSLPQPLRHAVANTKAPSKQHDPDTWIDRPAFEAYLRESDAPQENSFLRDADVAATEQMIGIGIDPDRQVQDGKQFYSAHYLRLRDNCSLGLFASAMDKRNGNPDDKRDLLADLFQRDPSAIIVGGQQRTCTASVTPSSGANALPLPRGLSSASDFHRLSNGKFAVKWILLAPAIWPEIPKGTSKRGTERRHHPGGWLPNWICPETGKVLLQVIDAKERKRRRRLNYASEGYESTPDIGATLVAAVIKKPLVVTGWALPDEHGRAGGAKSTHLAVPAGAAYYFEADDESSAEKLAAALNWHRTSADAEIRNRRSTLLGEKGYGLGLCGTWRPISR